MQILNNAICARKVSRPTFDDLHEKLELVAAMVKNGYKAEALEILNVVQGIALNLESQNSRVAYVPRQIAEI